MGLDTSHGCWHGAYSAFMAWRVELAKAAGVPLMLMDNFISSSSVYVEGIDALIERLETPPAFNTAPGGGFVATRDSLMTALQAQLQMDPDTRAMHSVLRAWSPWLPLTWDQLRPDVIHVLLNHSDCDGEIAAADCGPLADRLEELIPLLPEGGNGGHVQNWKEKTQTFVDGLRLAASLGEAVDFH